MRTPLERFGHRARRAMDEAQPPFDEAAGRRRWLARSTPAKGTRRLRFALAVGVAGLGLVAAVAALWRPGRDERVFATESAITLPFEPGSQAVVAPDSELRVVSRTSAGARVEVLRGRVDVEVRHRPETDWHVLAGPWDVVVTGTRLAVEWSPASARAQVEVFEGVVEVRGPKGSTTVRAGERFDSSPGLVRPAPAPPRDAEPVAVAFDAVDAGRPVRRAPPAAARPWVELELAGRYLEARDAVRARGVDRVLAAAAPEELLAVARAARFAGDDGLATEALETARRRFAGTGAAAMAAFLLGRESQGAEAAAWFQRYLDEEPEGALAREAAGRLLEALMQAGKLEAAQRAARDYLERYPTGPHAPYARSLREMVKP